jgi:hypothetical protein
MVLGFPTASIADDGYNFSNIAHEFVEQESRLDLDLANNAAVHMVWPVEEPPFFWFEHLGTNLNTAARAKEVLIRVGIVPTLTPVDARERVLSRDHLRSHLETKLASRHFRNNLLATKEDSRAEFEELIEFLLANTPEISSLSVDAGLVDDEYRILVQYRDRNSALPKDLFWAGDGLQIWLQLLFHLWRTRESSVILLDEPDVFLHPDLQRRLVRVLEATGRQTVMASHSAEVAGEASISNLTWVDRHRKTSRRVGDDREMQALSASLGTTFNLSMARALRAKTVLFVEGDDMKVLRVLASKVGATWFADEVGIAIVPIGGFSHWPGVEAFGWLKRRFLGDRVHARVLLDRDYRMQHEVDLLLAKLYDSGVDGHVWVRKELESYLLEMPTLGRASGLREGTAAELAESIVESLESQTRGAYVRVAVERRGRSPEATARQRAEDRFDYEWAVPENRLSMVPAKRFISTWNDRARAVGGKVITSVKLAGAIRLDEVDPEMTGYLRAVEAELR